MLYSLLGEHQAQDRLASLVISDHVFVCSVYSMSKNLWCNFQTLLLGTPGTWIKLRETREFIYLVSEIWCWAPAVRLFMFCQYSNSCCNQIKTCTATVRNCNPFFISNCSFSFLTYLFWKKPIFSFTMNHQKLNLIGCHITKQSVYLRGDYSPLLYVKVLLRTLWGRGFEETAKILDTLIYVLYPIRLLPTDTHDIKVWKWMAQTISSGVSKTLFSSL